MKAKISPGSPRGYIAVSSNVNPRRYYVKRIRAGYYRKEYGGYEMRFLKLGHPEVWVWWAKKHATLLRGSACSLHQANHEARRKIDG